MDNGQGPARGADWIVAGDETRGESGQIRVSFHGARGGFPRGSLELWAYSVDDAVTFLRGCTEALEAKYGRIITPAVKRN